MGKDLIGAEIRASTRQPSLLTKRLLRGAVCVLRRFLLKKLNARK